MPLGSWYCPVCRAAGIGEDEDASTQRFGAAEVQERLERTGRTRSRRGARTRGRRGEIVRTGHLERIRRAVNDVVSQLGSASRKKKGRARKSKGGRKRKSGGKRRKCGSSKKSYKERRTDSAMLDNVRAALGIAAPATHWSEVQSSGSFSLFGSAAAFDPMGSEGEDDGEDAPGFSSPGTRVMPRHLAVERLAMARRRRNKVSVAPPVASVEGPVDLLSGIMSGQMGLLAPRRPTPPRVDGRYLAPKVKH